MNTWKNTGYTKPSWQGAYLHANEDQKIIWDSHSLFYALQNDLNRFYTIHFVRGMYPNPRSDKQVMPDRLETHYIGNALLGLKTGYDLGSAQSMDDCK